jgi:hypothetical protein
MSSSSVQVSTLRGAHCKYQQVTVRMGVCNSVLDCKPNVVAHGNRFYVGRRHVGQQHLHPALLKGVSKGQPQEVLRRPVSFSGDVHLHARTVVVRESDHALDPAADHAADAGEGWRQFQLQTGAKPRTHARLLHGVYHSTLLPLL